MNVRSAMILAGGLGTRLRSVVRDVPKPMADVAGKPWLTYLVAYLKTFGIEHVVLCVGHLAHVVEEHFGDGASMGVQIDYSYEDKPLGTAGAFAAAGQFVKEDTFLGLNGDSFCPADLHALIQQHRQLQTLATLTVTQVDDVSRFGSVRINEKTRITCFEEKGQACGSGWVNAGMYVLTPDALSNVPPGEMYSIEKQVFPALVQQGLGAYCTDALMIDIGTPESYLSAARVLGELWPDAMQQF